MPRRMNEDARQANERFVKVMAEETEVMRTRGFDENGLGRRMPFV